MGFDQNGDWHDDDYAQKRIELEETVTYKLAWSLGVILRLVLWLVIIAAICGGVYACGKFIVD